MSRSQFQSKRFILRHAWLNLWDERMTTGRINQVAIFPRAFQTTLKQWSKIVPRIDKWAASNSSRHDWSKLTLNQLVVSDLTFPELDITWKVNRPTTSLPNPTWTNSQTPNTKPNVGPKSHTDLDLHSMLDRRLVLLSRWTSTNQTDLQTRIIRRILFRTAKQQTNKLLRPPQCDYHKAAWWCNQEITRKTCHSFQRWSHYTNPKSESLDISSNSNNRHRRVVLANSFESVKPNYFTVFELLKRGNLSSSLFMNTQYFAT